MIKKTILLLFLLSNSVLAKVEPLQQLILDPKLTPMGAIKASNDKSIPKWTGEIEQYLDEKPLFTINHNNYLEHTKHLTLGQLALFKQYQSFEMPIYPTHRTAIAPQWVYENTSENANKTTLNQSQTGIENYKAGIPFPIPKSALHIYFNHIGRWRGKQLKNQASDAVVFENGKFTLFTRNSLARFDSYIDDSDNKYFVSLISKTLAPATKSGSGVLVLEPLDQLNGKRAAWLWDKGRRRVIRAPNIAYDNPVPSSSSLRTVDDTDLINGSPDRFNWKMLEKREIYIAYNNDKLASKELRYKDILNKKHINPAHARYELHRVWVIEATLKEKWRHIYSKRTFYIDEDSWQVMVADQYNKQGKLWRVSISYPKFFAAMPGIFPVINVFHDLASQKYHVMGLQNQESGENVFNGDIAKDSLFTPSGFKRFMR